MGTGEFTAGGNPALHATETGISSGLMGPLARKQTLLYVCVIDCMVRVSAAKPL